MTRAELDHAVGELDFAARALFDQFQDLEDLQPEIFQILELIEKGAGGEIQLTDGMIQLRPTESFHGVRFYGRTYDCGSRLGFLTANIAFASTGGDIAPGLKEELRRPGFLPLPASSDSGRKLLAFRPHGRRTSLDHGLSDPGRKNPR